MELTETLKALQVDRQLEAVTRGWDTLPAGVFCNEHGSLFHHNPVRIAFYDLLGGAGVRRVRFHDLRHTFASLLLQQGESSVYVKDQMEHSSIQVTVDLYGHLIPSGNRQAVDQLDSLLEVSAQGGKTAPQAHPLNVGEAKEAAEAMETSEEPRRRYGVSARPISEHFC